MRLASEGVVAAASWTARNSRTIARISDRARQNSQNDFASNADVPAETDVFEQRL